MEREEVKKLLKKSGWGSFSDWREAVEIAKREGWTQKEVEHVFFIHVELRFVAILWFIILIFIAIGILVQ